VEEPAIEALGPDEGYTLDYEAPVTLKAYWYGAVSASRRSGVRRALRRWNAMAVAGRLRWRSVRTEDWAESWKQYYDVERVGRVVIRPAWLEAKAAASEVVVALDPGMAFGTGQHPTTRMCLALMQELGLEGKKVLDVGTGSGILGLAALALGARSCLAFDIEEQAVASAKANIDLNGAGAAMDVRPGSISGLGLMGYDVVFANISAAAVTMLAPDLAKALASDGVLFAGGIIEERLEAPVAALEAAGMRIERVVADGDWRTLVVRRR
jgi:ribosomal protein L11 methyltransferase